MGLTSITTTRTSVVVDMAIRVNSAFKKLLLNISENITTEKLESMKFLCEAKIPRAEIDRLKTPLAILDALVVNGFVTENNTTFLDELLCDLRLHQLRTDLLRIYQGKMICLFNHDTESY